MGDGFKGFPADAFCFFEELSRNNNREWFAANKDRYKQSVVEPMCRFIEAMDTRLARVSDCFVADPRPHGGSMFRIYRDVRFSADKRPYKEHAACHFRHMAGKDAHAPGFYVHIEPGNVFFGGGMWHPPGPVLRNVREAIDYDQSEWRKILRAPAFKKRFGSLAGESLKRPPQGFDASHPLIEDLKRKDFFAVQHVEPELALEARFADEVARAFAALKPLMRFLTEAAGLSFSLSD